MIMKQKEEARAHEGCRASEKKLIRLVDDIHSIIMYHRFERKRSRKFATSQLCNFLPARHSVILFLTYSSTVVPKEGCTSPWRTLGLPRGALRSKGQKGDAGGGHIRARCSLICEEMTSDQTLGNWYHFIQPIHRIKSLLTVT
jgi:hypothetical protein